MQDSDDDAIGCGVRTRLWRGVDRLLTMAETQQRAPTPTDALCATTLDR